MSGRVGGGGSTLFIKLRNTWGHELPYKYVKVENRIVDRRAMVEKRGFRRRYRQR